MGPWEGGAFGIGKGFVAMKSRCYLGLDVSRLASPARGALDAWAIAARAFSQTTSLPICPPGELTLEELSLVAIGLQENLHQKRKGTPFEVPSPFRRMK